MHRRLRALLAIAPALLLLAATDAYPEDVSGDFRLSKESYCVGEPILVEFRATNGGSSGFSFYEGGDYRGTLRHERYSFRVASAAGRDFTQAQWGNFGGLGNELELEAGRTFRSWQLLNGWTHLLPPGRYRAYCERSLSAESVSGAEEGDKPGASVTIRSELVFDVTPYSREQISAAIEALHALDASEKRALVFYSVPVGWALEDLNRKFAVGVDASGKEVDLENAVLSALPKAWDDRLYVEYGFKANRNWLTADAPEEFVVTFSARNNGTVDLPHRFGESILTVNGVVPPTWPELLETVLDGRQSGDTVAPGAVVEIPLRLNDVLPPGGTARLVFTVHGVAISAEVRFARPSGDGRDPPR